MDWITILGILFAFFAVLCLIPKKLDEDNNWSADIDRFNEEEES